MESRLIAPGSVEAVYSCGPGNAWLHGDFLDLVLRHVSDVARTVREVRQRSVSAVYVRNIAYLQCCICQGSESQLPDWKFGFIVETVIMRKAQEKSTRKCQGACHIK